ncbi:MAG: ATP-binding cassette domain-containing protein [Spirochaetes bacterium]|nr:ATP-binding cassette domain-containing protein [Spirochaetota bacterium]
MREYAVEFRDVTFGFADKTVFKDLSIAFVRSEFTAIVGASGEGLSTLLKLADGLYSPQGGTIITAGIDLTAAKKPELMKMKSRNGFVFQDDALLSSRSAYQNLSLHAKYNTHKPDAEIDAEITAHAAHLGISKERLLTARPNVMNNREKRFVNLMRATLHRPEILFLDSVFDGVDQQTDSMIRREICRLVTDNAAMTVIAVCSKISEFKLLAQRVVAMRDHAIYFDGTMDEYKQRQEDDDYLKEFL